MSWLAGDAGRSQALLAKSFLSAWTVVLLIGTTPMTALMAGFTRLGVPSLVAEVILMLVRYLTVLIEQATSLRPRGQFPRCFGLGQLAVGNGHASESRSGYDRRALPHSDGPRHAHPPGDACAGASRDAFPALHSSVWTMWDAALVAASVAMITGVQWGSLNSTLNLLETRGLRYRYADGQEALRGIDFTLAPGETAILLGANWVGQDDLPAASERAAGAAPVRSTCAGLRLADGSLAAIRSKVGLVFQDADDQLFLPTVIEDVCFGLLNQGLAPAQALERAPRHASRGSGWRRWPIGAPAPF